MQRLLFILSLLLYGTVILAQGKDELLKKRQQLKREIELTEKALNETRKTTKENIVHLNHINKIIDLQGNVIENISGQLKFIETDIVKSQREVNKWAKVLDTLKQEYAKSMVYAYKNRNSYDFLNFIFSASSFNDAIKRITYLKSYRNYREMQGDNILKTQALLGNRIKQLSGNKEKKNEALNEKNKELTQLEKQQVEKERIVQKLKGRQNELAAEVANKRKQDAKIRSLITTMINREIAIARKKAETERIEREKANKAKPDNNISVVTTKSRTRERKVVEDHSSLVSSDADRVLNADFERNRGSLPWPVDGFILTHYGRYTIPGTKNVIGDNPGVSIGTQVGSPVKAIFAGEVTLVNFMDDKQLVCIKHGKYFTVYSNLSSASVQRGQVVKTGQVIGKAALNDDGQGQVDLLLMKETNNINPESWMHRK